MKDKKAGVSIIDKSLRVEGTVNVVGKLIILGVLEGTLIGNTVVTAEGSHVVAQAKVKEIVIGGEFEGDVTAYESLKIMKTGRLRGNVACNNLDIEPGGQLNGSVRTLEATDEIPASNA